jgi:plasmid stability protein
LPTLTIKGMPDALYECLKARAAQHRRSLNHEILVVLEQTVVTAVAEAHVAPYVFRLYSYI